jgi:PAS domain S-box-containing protein
MFKGISIEKKIMIVFAFITVVLFLTVGVLFLNSTQTAVNSSKERELTTLSQETSNKIERFLFERYGDIKVISESPILKSGDISRELKLNYLDSVRAAYETYDYILVTDANGEIDLASGNENGDDSYKKYIPFTEKGQIFVSDFIYNEKSKAYTMYFVSPIMDGSGRFAGAVVERMNFFSIDDIIKNVQPGKSGYAYLVDSSGKTILSSSGNTPQLAGTIKSSQGILYSQNGSTSYISALYPLKKYDTQTDSWSLVVEEPVREAFEVTTKLRNYIIITILFSAIALLVLANIMTKLITRPIKKLVLKTQSAAEGDFVQDISIESRDEIGSLAASFNILLSNLKSMMSQVLEVSGEIASLEEIRQYVDRFFENIPSAIITADVSGTITSINNTACKILGCEKEAVLGKNIFEENIPAQIDQVVDLMKQGLENEAVHIKHILKVKNTESKEIPVMMNTSIQKDSSGKILGVIAAFRSVEEIKKFEESMVRARNLASIGELSAGMAHEIRNPLTSIKGYAQFIKLELGEDSPLSEDINIIISEVDRLNGILDRFLTFARPRQPKLENCNVNDIIKDIVKLLGMNNVPENIVIQTELEPLPDTAVDQEQIEQAFLNVAINAVQAMKNGGKLTFGTHYDPGEKVVVINISDTGPGIPSESLEEIFEPFFTTKPKGTGLGLAITSTIIESHKGFIEVKTIPEQGTVFTIKLPTN